MGNVQSADHVSMETFKDQVFSQAVFFVSKYANHQLEFKNKTQCTPDELPKLKKPDFTSIIDYYQGGDGDLDYCIENYLNKHVLNSLENVTRFHKILIAKLSQDSSDLLEEAPSDDEIDLVSVASNVKQFIDAGRAMTTAGSGMTTVGSGGGGRKAPEEPALEDNAPVVHVNLVKNTPTERTHTTTRTQPIAVRPEQTSSGLVPEKSDSVGSGQFDEQYEISEATIPDSLLERKCTKAVASVMPATKKPMESSNDDECLVSKI